MPPISHSNKDQTSLIPDHTSKLLLGLLILAILLFSAGIILPMITVSKFVLIKTSFSIVSGVIELFLNGQILLSIVVASFSIILPIMKISILFKLLSKKEIGTSQIKRYLHLMHAYGRWAMLDVMVVAVLIVTVKLGAIASVEVHYGLFVFGAAVVLIMFITNKVVHLTNLKH